MQAPSNSAISPKFYQFLITLIILVGVTFRFYDLGARPVHHDESLHGTYARYAVENPDQSFYHYNPMLHGPLLYNCLAWLFSTFGVSTIVLRSLNAGLGSLFLFSPLLFRRFISPSAVLWSTAALAFSPSLIYWSRFAHHDYLVLASYLLLASGILLAKARVGIIFCLISFALQYTIKANIFVFFALLVGFLVFHLLCTMLIKERNGEKVKIKDTVAVKVWNVVCSNKIASVIGACLSAIIFSALYSGNFRDSSGILDGLYRKVFTYWIEQHHIQRLDGPFSFHLLVLFLYELPLLLAFLAALLLAALKLPKLQKGALLVLTLVFLLTPMLLPAELFNKGFLDTYLKVKSPFDLFVSLEIALLAVMLSIDFYRKNYLALSFFSYLSLATLWTYSFLGEKVPWLTIYPQISALAFIVLFFDKYGWFERGLLSLGNSISVTKFFAGLSAIILTATTICILEGLVMRDPAALSENILRLLGWSFFSLITFIALEANQISAKVPALAIGLFLALSLYTSILTNFTRAGDKRELLSQVHTNQEIHDLFLTLKTFLTNPLKKSEPKVLVSGNAVWPATWYFRNLPGFQFSADKTEYSTFDYLVVDENDDGIDENFDWQFMPLQSWWVPDYSKLRFKTLVSYYFTHEPWSTPGSLQVKFAVPIDSKDGVLEDESLETGEDSDEAPQEEPETEEETMVEEE